MRALVISLAAATTVARADPAPPAWTFGVEPRMGVLLSRSKLDANVIGGFELGLALPHDGMLGLDASFAQPHHTAGVMDDGLAATYTLEQTQIVIGLTVNYRFFDSSHAFVPHVGFGPLWQLLKSTETTTATPGQFTASETQIGGEAGGGVDYKVGRGSFAVDVRFLYARPLSACAILPIYIPLCNADGPPLTGGATVYNIAITGGYRFVF